MSEISRAVQSIVRTDEGAALYTNRFRYLLNLGIIKFYVLRTKIFSYNLEFTRLRCLEYERNRFSMLIEKFNRVHLYCGDRVSELAKPKKQSIAIFYWWMLFLRVLVMKMEDKFLIMFSYLSSMISCQFFQNTYITRSHHTFLSYKFFAKYAVLQNDEAFGIELSLTNIIRFT